MKKILFAAMAATVLFASCAKENATDTNNGQEAQITVNLASNQTRATGPTVLANEQKINDFVVFLFRADGTIDGKASSSTPDATSLSVSGTTAAASVYVLVNTGTIGTGLLSTVTNKNDLLAATGDLMSSANTASQTGTSLWMAGNGTVGTFSTGSTPTATASVDVYFVAAKIKVVVDDQRTNRSSIVDNKIVLLFAGAKGKFFENTSGDRAVQNTFYTGDASYADPFTTGVTASTALSENYATSNVYFYTFANNGTTQPTILAIQSTKTIESTPSTIYYPAQFTTADLGQTIEPGKEYTVTLKLTGDVAGGGGGGTTDPEDPFISASVTVTVTVNPWTPVILEKTFN